MFSKGRAWQQKLDDIVTELRRGDRHEATVAEILKETGCPEPARLAVALAEKTKAGQLSRVFQVVSQGARKSVAEYQDLMDIPEEVTDPATNQAEPVLIENIRVLFRAPGRD